MHVIATNVVLVCLLGQPGLQNRARVAIEQPDTLLQQRLDAARRAYKESYDLYREGRTRDVDRVYRWSERWLRAEEELRGSKADQLAALEGHWRRMKQLEDLVRGLYKAGVLPLVEVPAVEYYRLDAEIALSKIRGK